MKTKLRKATLEDVKTMQNFMYDLMKEELEQYDPTNKITWAKSKHCAEYFSGRIINNNEYAMIAEVDGKVVGYLSGYVGKGPVYRSLTKLGVLGDMYVSKDFRNQKIGTKLINDFKKWATTKGARKIRTEVFTKNVKAVRFYQRHGFDDYTSILEK